MKNEEFCEFARENFDEYINNELNEEIFKKIKSHLVVCGDCREYFSKLKNLKANYPDFGKKIPYPRNLEEKLKKLFKDLEKTKV